nr:MAG TPA: hypothetical protein [Bacteriophage sp.]
MEVLIWCHLLDGKCCASVALLCLNAETFRRLHTSQRCSAYACLYSPVRLVYQSPPAAALLFCFAKCDARRSSQPC